MTERKRPWWMLHWPSWLALVLLSGAFVVLNVFVAVAPSGFSASQDDIATWPNTGWPFVTHRNKGNAPRWLWQRDGRFRFAGLAAPIWNESMLVVNGVCGVTLIVLSVGFVEGFCRQHAVLLTTRVVVALTAWACCIAAAVSSGRFTSLGFADDTGVDFASPDIAVVAIFLMCTAVGLASFAVLDGIGWLFARLSKREA